MTTNIQTNSQTTFLSTDGDKSITISQLGLNFKRDILTTPIETIFTPLDITDVNTGNSITIDRLTYLPIGLAALTVPTDGLTCNFNDAIQLQDYNTTLVPPPTHSEVKIGSNPSTLYGMNINTTTSTPFTITGDTGLDANITNAINLTSSTDSITITADDNITLNSVGLGNIRLDAPNISSYNYAMPICFTTSINSGFNYTNTGQIFDMVYQSVFAIPQEFVSISPLPGPFISTNWKIDFAFNMYQVSAMNDKGKGIYIDFRDNQGNIYTPITYNDSTPFSIDRKDFGYASGANAPFIPINWNDYVDLGALYNTGTSNFPFDMRIWFAADNPISSNFNVLLTLTKTNII
jgi:hypothetical protein